MIKEIALMDSFTRLFGFNNVGLELSSFGQAALPHSLKKDFVRNGGLLF